MKRIVPAAAAVIAAASVPAAEPGVSRGDPVVVTATRFTERPRQFPVGVEVIGEEEIRRTTAMTLPELLSQRAGIRTRDLSGSPDVQVDMRGFGISGDQNTLVLLDGRRVSEYELATVNWSAIPLSSIASKCCAAAARFSTAPARAPERSTSSRKRRAQASARLTFAGTLLRTIRMA
jgi:iron complex outermembrane receptor protein